MRLVCGLILSAQFCFALSAFAESDAPPPPRFVGYVESEQPAPPKFLGFVESDAPPPPRFVGFVTGDFPPPCRPVPKHESLPQILDLEQLVREQNARTESVRPTGFTEPQQVLQTAGESSSEQLMPATPTPKLVEIPSQPPVVAEAFISTDPSPAIEPHPESQPDPATMNVPVPPEVELPDLAPVPDPTPSTSPSSPMLTPQPSPAGPDLFPDPDPFLTMDSAPPQTASPEFNQNWMEDECCPGSFADECQNCLGTSDLAPFIDLMIMPGSERTVTEIRGMLPLWETNDSLIYSDLRAQFDNKDASTGIFGVGYRFIDGKDWIWGVYGYFDHMNTTDDNSFNQFTTGIEVLTLERDFRITAYFPNQGGESADRRSGFSNGTVFTHDFQERAYRGFEIEYGCRLLHWGWQDSRELRWFNGIYHLGNSASGFRSITGPKSRLEYRCYALPWLGNQSRFEAGVELSHDQLRDTQFWGFARLRIPLSPKASQPLPDPIRRRFADLPRRQIY